MCKWIEFGNNAQERCGVWIPLRRSKRFRPPALFAKESPAVSKAAKACIAVPPNALPPKDRYAALSGVWLEHAQGDELPAAFGGTLVFALYCVRTSFAAQRAIIG